MASQFVSPSEIRTRFSQAMSDMYKAEVPQYGTLLKIVSEVNASVLTGDQPLAQQLKETDQLSRLDLERHGAIRVGSGTELATIRGLFGIMGMFPVGYYDLTVAGVPVHSTAFRPVDKEALSKNPFRVFTSLLRLELIENQGLREAAKSTLAKRNIFTPRCLELIAKSESQGGLGEDDANAFVREALETFRWHKEATVTAELYKNLRSSHPLIADIVSFKGPHINHLTPRTLDIDEVQRVMPHYGIKPKAVIEGPARRKCAILLRQTSFLALNEPVSFLGTDGSFTEGSHTARFGEIEQRGIALTPKGRQLYDVILDRVRQEIQPAGDGSNKDAYCKALDRHFLEFPDTYEELRRQGLAYFHYEAKSSDAASTIPPVAENVDKLVEAGVLTFTPIIYEDFLPVSAAGIFQSNLGNENKEAYMAKSNRQAFEEALGSSVQDELALYAKEQAESLDAALGVLSLKRRR